jgi:hypothetical protein
MQSGGQFKSIEFTALAAKTGAENSEVPKCQSLPLHGGGFGFERRSRRAGPK